MWDCKLKIRTEDFSVLCKNNKNFIQIIDTGLDFSVSQISYGIIKNILSSTGVLTLVFKKTWCSLGILAINHKLGS